MIIAMDHLVQSEVYNKLDKEFLNLLESKSDRTFRLTRNYRNPRSLANRASSLIDEVNVLADRNLKSPPVFHSTKNSNDKKLEKLKNIVSELINKGIRPRDISILTFRTRKNQSFMRLMELGIINYWI